VLTPQLVAFDKYRLTVPVRPTPFPPDRAERISVNSFGIGGTNAHVSLARQFRPYSTNHAQVILEACNPPRTLLQNGVQSPRSELLLFSANGDASLSTQIHKHEDYVRTTPARNQDIAYTRAVRREHLPHRAFAILDNGELTGGVGAAKAPPEPPPVTMIFSGQGAQWPQMGKELIQTDINFRKDISRMDDILQKLVHPPAWKLLGTSGRFPFLVSAC